MNTSRFLFSFLFIAFFFHPASSQIKLPSYSIETGSSLSGGRETPFWLLSNQYGLITPNKYNEWVKAGIQKTQTKGKKLDYDYGLDLVNRYSNKNEIYIHQAYLRLKLYFVNIQAGKIEEKFGNQDSSLSSGGLLWSGNARPMPKVSIMVPNYTTVPFTFGWFEFKGGMSHGWFDDNQFVKHAWLHHKFGYIQFGGKLPVHIHYGLNDYAQWGGKTSDGVQLPHSFKDFIKVFFAKSGGSDAPTPDVLNALGNHIGSRNFGLDVELSKLLMSLYWQNIFEDGSGKAYRNIKDGLWGFSIHTKEKNRPINGFVYEFINTTDQSGTYNDYWLLNGKRYLNSDSGGVHHEAGGNDNYFNNGIYQFGWTYQDMTIGTPLITSPAIMHGNASDYIRNNKVTGHHFGIEGIYKKFAYKVFYTYYRNFGTNAYPISPNKPQHSILIQTNISNKLPWGIDLGLKGGLDIGKMYGNNIGIEVSLIKRGPF
jgi:hypothetical protein